MPKKTNGIPFKLQPRPTKGDDGKPLLYAQVVTDVYDFQLKIKLFRKRN